MVRVGYIIGKLCPMDGDTWISLFMYYRVQKVHAGGIIRGYVLSTVAYMTLPHLSGARSSMCLKIIHIHITHYMNKTEEKKMAREGGSPFSD